MIFKNVFNQQSGCVETNVEINYVFSSFASYKFYLQTYSILMNQIP